MRGKWEKTQARRLGRNVRFLRLRADLTIQGLAAAVNISVNHLRLIEAGKSNITARTAGKICGFFGIGIAVLYAPAHPDGKSMKEKPAVRRFYRENQRNPQFFMSGKDENSATYFVKEVLLKKKFFRKKRKVSDVVKESRAPEYQKDFKSKELSQVLIRLVNDGVLAREDESGTGKRFLYYEPALVV